MTTRPFIRNLPSSGSYYGRQHMVLNNFAGGLNNVDNESVIKDNQMVDCQNMMFSDNYTVEKRYGLSLLNAGEEGALPITWYDEYTSPDGNKNVVTASESKLYINDIYICDVSDTIEGVNFNGQYYFVDGSYLHRVNQNADGSFSVYKIITDPKLYIDYIGESYVKEVDGVDTTKTLYSVFEDTNYQETYYCICQEDINDEGNPIDYSASTTYYLDPFGHYEVTHGDGNGEVNSGSYLSYYVEKTRTVTKRGINLYGFYTTHIPQNVGVGSVFTFNNNLICHYTNHDFDVSIDSVTGLLKYTDSTSLEPYEFIITEIDYNNGAILFSPAKIVDGEYVADTDDVEKRRIYSDDMQDAFIIYDDITDADEKLEYMSSALANIICNNLIRCYKPRTNEYSIGETISTANGLIWYQPCENELAYAFLGENYIPNNPRNIAVFNGRLWTTGDYGQLNEIRASNVNQPFYYPAAMSLAMNPNGDEVQDVFEFDGALIVGRKQDMYAVYGNSTSDESSNLFNIKKLDSTTGFMGSNCGSLINNFFLFLGYDGKLYKMTTPTTNTDYLMIKPVTIYIDLFKSPLGITREQMENLSSVALDNTVYWMVGDKIIVYSYTHMAFTYFTNWNATSLFTDGIDIFVGDSNGNRCKWTKGIYNDLGKPIQGLLKTKTYTLDSPTIYKYFEQSLFTFDKPEYVNGNITMVVYMDNRRKVLKETFPIFTSSFDNSEWDVTKFSGLPYDKTNWWRLNFRSRSICFIFYNKRVNETFRVIDIDTIYTGRDIR